MQRKKCALCTMLKLVLVIAIIVAIAKVSFNYFIYTPVDSENTGEISIVIKKGSNVKDVATLLKENDLIRNEFAFTLYSKYEDLDSKIIAGRFILQKSQNTDEILKTITESKTSESVITVQEGLAVRDIDTKLVNLDLIQPGDFNKAVQDFNEYETYSFINKEVATSLEYPLEGYLYPDTYFLDPGDFDNNDLIHKMLSNFENKIDPIRSEINNNEYTLHEILSMASILQKEVRTEDDMPIVAGILWKRLESNWHIGADATILYITGKQTISYDDLQIDSDYNTRLHVGLTPGPIGNPDIRYIKASLNPEDSEYWYYLTTLDTGEVIYAKNNDQHNINKAKYL